MIKSALLKTAMNLVWFGKKKCFFNDLIMNFIFGEIKKKNVKLIMYIKNTLVR